ncbi:hypothetical protein MNBD_UNCLBAC01-1947 [hydrothermal vent metagenome]|uniref:Lipoprotein n=1 Tax=hydrothermal vent metagenome TaxID=652676 RepID=A0A3B1E4L2_9ZZZZ
MGKFVKQFFAFILLFTIFGCATIVVPNYIQDKNPYKRKFYASFEKTFEATLAAVQEAGWVVEQQTDPSVFERVESGEFGDQQTLLITGIRKMGLFVGTRYAKLNIYIRTGSGNVSEVEIRYLSVNSTLVKNFYNYKHDKSAERLFLYIESALE